MKRICLITSMVAVLSACGGSDGVEPKPGLVAATSYGDHLANIDAIGDYLSSASPGSADPALLPTMAEYRGTMRFASTSDAFAGDMTVVADFAGSSIDGSVENIFRDTGEAWNGELQLDGAIVTGAADTGFTGTIDGTIDNGGRFLTYDGTTTAFFRGADGDNLSVFGGGDVTEPGFGSRIFDAGGAAFRTSATP